MWSRRRWSTRWSGPSAVSTTSAASTSFPSSASTSSSEQGCHTARNCATSADRRSATVCGRRRRVIRRSGASDGGSAAGRGDDVADDAAVGAGRIGHPQHHRRYRAPTAGWRCPVRFPTAPVHPLPWVAEQQSRCSRSGTAAEQPRRNPRAGSLPTSRRPTTRSTTASGISANAAIPCSRPPSRHCVTSAPATGISTRSSEPYLSSYMSSTAEPRDAGSRGSRRVLGQPHESFDRATSGPARPHP